jgi:uncharacterized membrane protein YcaP (DUF421 family)
MAWLAGADWERMFIPDTPLLEIIIRGSIIYLALFGMLRLVLKRQSGSLGMTDLLVLVLIADAAQNAMAANYHSLPDGIVLVATLIFWNFALDWLGYRYACFERLIHPSPLPLVRNGHFLRKNMRHELVTEDDLMSRLREKGVEHLHEVKEAFMEGDGKISVVKKE